MSARVLIYCAVLEEEVSAVVAQLPTSEQSLHLEMLPQGLHNEPQKLHQQLQAMIDRFEDSLQPEIILLGYGLCCRGTEGLRAKQATIIVPRAHDCITLLLGSKEEYANSIHKYPGTYWYSVGWNRHHVPPGPERVAKLRSEYVANYGEDNADFLMEEEQAWLQSYDRAAFVDTGVGDAGAACAYTAECAAFLGWKFDYHMGSLRLIEALLGDDWPESEFLVIPPGMSSRMAADESVVKLAD